MHMQHAKPVYWYVQFSLHFSSHFYRLVSCNIKLCGITVITVAMQKKIFFQGQDNGRDKVTVERVVRVYPIPVD